MPEKIACWIRTRELADSELKSLIEKQIISTAYRTFGDFHNKILLSLPPEKKVNRSINIGTIIYDKEKYPFGISRAELLQNLGIYGRSGGGKTNLAFHIIKQLDFHKIPYLFFDNKRTLRHLLPLLKNKVNVYTPSRKLSNFSFNPFITPSGLESSVYINQLVDVLASAFTLGDGSKSILQKAIFACYERGNLSPVITDVIREIEKIESKDRIKGWKISALRALESLNFSDIITSNTSQKELIEKLIQGNTVVELDGLGNGARKFLIPILYQWIFQVKLCSAVREKLSIAVFIDEAHLIFGQQGSRSDETLMERLLRQTREIGIASVIMDQTPSLISKVVLANCYTNIFLNLVSASDLTKAASVCLMDTDEKKYFSMLPVGQGIIKLQDRWTKPFLVKFPLVNINKGSVTDEVLSAYFRQNKNQPVSWNTLLKNADFSDISRVPLSDEPLTGHQLRFLQDIISYPYACTRERYKRLSLSIGKGSRLKERLIFKGWIEDKVIETGKTRKVLSQLTKEAQKTLCIEPPSFRNVSIEHEYWKHFYAQKYKNLGYQVNFEVPRKSGRIDVVAKNDVEQLAIEVETGKSDPVRNVRMNLLSGFNKVVVVAANEKALKIVERGLAREGLIIPQRIQIIQAGQ